MPFVFFQSPHGQPKLTIYPFGDGPSWLVIFKPPAGQPIRSSDQFGCREERTRSRIDAPVSQVPISARSPLIVLRCHVKRTEDFFFGCYAPSIVYLCR